MLLRWFTIQLCYCWGAGGDGWPGCSAMRGNVHLMGEKHVLDRVRYKFW